MIEKIDEIKIIEEFEELNILKESMTLDIEIVVKFAEKLYKYFIATNQKEKWKKISLKSASKSLNTLEENFKTLFNKNWWEQ